jgi:hypothetical protein
MAKRQKPAQRPKDAPKKWIQGAIRRKGAFRRKASAAGESTADYADQVLAKDSTASTRTKRQAVLAQTLGKLRKK